MSVESRFPKLEREVESKPEIMSERFPKDSIAVLISKISKSINEIRGLSFKKDLLWRRMQLLGDKENSFGLVALLDETRMIVRRQNLMKPAREKWNQALKAAKELVERENKLGHKGQLLFDLVFKDYFFWMNQGLIMFPIECGTLEVLNEAIDRLIVRVQNYQWPGKWCLVCGAPLPKGDQMTCSGKCTATEVKKAECDRFHDYTVPSSSSSGRHKKPGSAAYHGHGHAVNNNVRPRDRKKGKGSKTAK